MAFLRIAPIAADAIAAPDILLEMSATVAGKSGSGQAAGPGMPILQDRTERNRLAGRLLAQANRPAPAEAT